MTITILIALIWLLGSALLAYVGKPWISSEGRITWEVVLLWPVILPLAVWHSA